ncbi:MAG: PAS domain S-box protein [Planctomycetes bacterium]|nr:PAS domain S-box protein [Planctomycetota bacterium]
MPENRNPKQRQTITELEAELARLRSENDRLQLEVDSLLRSLARTREAEATLRLSEEKFRLLFENAYDEVIHLDKYGTVIDVNESVEKLFGFRREEVIGRNLADFPVFNPGTKQTMLRMFQSTLASSERQFTEVEVRHKDGHPVVVEPNGSLIKKDGQVEGILVFLKDVTERRNWKEKLEALYSQERQLRQQLEAEVQLRADFSRMLAHELKTPLTAILSSTDSLISELAPGRMLELARNVSRSAVNLSERVNDLLDLARDEIGALELDPESIDVLPTLRQSVENVQVMAETQGQSIRTDLPVKLPLVRADINRVNQILSNLLDNALKYAPRGGDIVLSAETTGNAVVIQIHDSGPGLSLQEQSRVFEPYERISSDNGRLSGLGLGLALCKRLVELHGGRVWVKSRPDREPPLDSLSR